MKPHQNAKSARQDAIDDRTRKRYSFRLPVALIAKLEALCEMHPNKKRSQILTDLITLGLEQVEHAAFNNQQEPAEVQPDTRQHVYLLTGPFSAFHGLVYKHHLALEHEQVIDQSEPIPAIDEYALNDNL
jgi:predicted DNA-binding protein